MVWLSNGPCRPLYQNFVWPQVSSIYHTISLSLLLQHDVAYAHLCCLECLNLIHCRLCGFMNFEACRPSFQETFASVSIHVFHRSFLKVTQITFIKLLKFYKTAPRVHGTLRVFAPPPSKNLLWPQKVAPTF